MLIDQNVVQMLCWSFFSRIAFVILSNIFKDSIFTLRSTFTSRLHVCVRVHLILVLRRDFCIVINKYIIEDVYFTVSQKYFESMIIFLV